MPFRTCTFQPHNEPASRKDEFQTGRFRSSFVMLLRYAEWNEEVMENA
jgi:hypothetical protein